ncbi:MAG TPA: sugar-binding protein [Tepidisphaeraceae bacterium]|nr:sugar-binding protein [Tepidisphaeraceae bacterium]
MNRRWITSLALCGLLSVASGAGVAVAKTLKLAFVTNNAAAFWTICRAGCEKAHDENPDIQVNFEIPGDASAAGQKQIIDDLLAQGVDGIAISPVDPANETPMLNDVASQTLLITTDSDAPASNRACYIGTNNADAGKQAGGLIKEALPNGGKIMIFVGSLDAQNARDRYNGIQQALAGSNIQIIDVRTDGGDSARAKANVEDALVKYPDIAGLMGLYSYDGPAILNAVRESGKNGQIKIVCFDEDEDTLAGVKSGDIYATVVQQPFEFGRKAMELMAQVLGGDKSVIPDSKQIFIPTLAIKKDTVDDFKAKLDKLKGQ